MASQEFKIDVERRDSHGAKDVRKLRKTGFTPGIYYAQDQETSISFQVDTKLLQQALASEALVYHVSVGGERRNVLIKELQFHPVTDELMHVDFKGVRMDEMVEVRVPVHIIGFAIGVKDEGGQLHSELLELDVRCKASDIPTHFDIDISELNIGDAIHVGDLSYPNIEIITHADSSIVSVAHPKGPEEELEEELEDELGEFEETDGEEAPEETDSEEE